MGKLVLILSVFAVGAGGYHLYFAEEWTPMALEGVGVSALAPSAGESVEDSSLDRLLGRFKVSNTTCLDGNESYGVSRMTSRNISGGQITLSQYEKRLVDFYESDYKLTHVSSELIEHEGAKGVELKFLLPDGSTESYSRLLIQPDALYEITFIGPAKFKNSLKRHRFFRSIGFSG